MSQTHLCPWCAMETAVGERCSWCKQMPPIKSQTHLTPQTQLEETFPSKILEGGRAHPAVIVVYISLLVCILLVGGYLLREGIASNPTAVNSESSGPPLQRSQPGLMPDEKRADQTGNAPVAPTTPDSPDSSGGSARSEATQSFPSALPPEPLPAPVRRLAGHVRIGDARLSIDNDGHGAESAVGRVLIVNDGDYEITDFRLSLEAGAGSYVLVPFEGSLAYPTPISYRHIPPGGQLEVPVMTTGYYTSYSAYGVKYINIEASVDGPPGLVTDRCSIL